MEIPLRVRHILNGSQLLNGTLNSNNAVIQWVVVREGLAQELMSTLIMFGAVTEQNDLVAYPSGNIRLYGDINKYYAQRTPSLLTVTV